jgi:hypothetical protein
VLKLPVVLDWSAFADDYVYAPQRCLSGRT